MTRLQFAPGAVLAVRAPILGGLGAVDHVGIASDAVNWDGEQLVINASKRTGCVLEEPISTFSQNEEVREVAIWGSLDGAEVVYRARQRMGEEWRLMRSNCEHFVRWAHGLYEESPQVAGALMAGGGITLAACLVYFLSGDE